MSVVCTPGTLAQKAKTDYPKYESSLGYIPTQEHV